MSVGKAFCLKFSLEERGEGLFTSRHRCAREKIPGIFSGGGSVVKFLEVTLNGARVTVRIANVINIFLDRDNKF